MLFRSARKRRKEDQDLFSIKQDMDESLEDYFARFTKTTAQIPKLDTKTARSVLMNNLADGQFKLSLYRDGPDTFDGVRELISKQIYAEGILRSGMNKAQQIHWDRPSPQRR